MFHQQSQDVPATSAGGVGGASTAGTGISGPTLFEMMGTRRRATLSLSDLRTPLVENLMSMLPMGHDKALKYALYNVLALILTAVCIVAFWAAYCILEPFIVPLLWALLVGSAIHPFKDRVVSFTRQWIIMVKASSIPLSLQLVYIPFRAVDSVSESIGSRVANYWKGIVVGSIVFFLAYIIYHNPPVSVFLFLYWLVVALINGFLWIVSWINGQIVFSVTFAYFLVILHYVYGVGAVPLSGSENEQQRKQGQGPDGDSKMEGESLDQEEDKPKEDQTDIKVKSSSQQAPILRGLSVTAWLSWFIYICQFLPYPVLLVVLISLGVGSAAFARKYSFQKPADHLKPFTTTLKSFLASAGGPRSAPSSRGVSRKGSLLQLRNPPIMKTPSPAGSTPAPQSQPIHSESVIEFKNVSKSAGLIDTPTYSIKKMKTNLDLKIPKEEQEESNETRDETACTSTVEFCQIVEDSLYEVTSEDEVDGLLDSNKFLYIVFCACLVVQVWNRLWLVHLLPIPVIYYGVKRACISFGLYDYLHKQVYERIRRFYMCEGINSRNVFPQPIRVFFGIQREADKKLISAFESYLDMIATILILVAVVVVSVIFMIFVATQFYAEGDHLVRVGANVINSTVSQYPEISQLLPEGWESLTGSLVGKAYHYGRDYIKTYIRDSVAERNPEKAEQMEKQVIELWDRIYINWNRTWDHMDNVGGKAPEGVGWDDIVKTGQNWFDTNMLVSYAKANYGQLLAVFESLWTVLIGNVSLAISAITSVFSVLFGGGSALLNLIINFVVFFTALFYLLSSSTSLYKPVEIFNSWLPGDGKRSSSFVFAIEESVSGVFSATIKMSAFYGMWTWLIHTLFQVNIVFVPSFFAAIFAAVPLLMPYWAVFPAVLELWLIQGQWTKALFMLLAQMAPMSMVDAQIYSEIKGGGHPYLTALAVAGGIFYFGFQGAIVGPVVLCFLFVAAKLGSSYMKEGTLDD